MNRLVGLMKQSNVPHSEEVSSWCRKAEAAGKQVKELEEELRVTRREDSEVIDWLKETLVR
jgi:hypothetical protein